jgi:phage terminase large subunit
VLKTEIRCKNGTGVIIFQGLQDHTADSIKSLEGFDICWVEEAQTISQFSLELLIPTIRKENSLFYFSWNPRYPNDPIEEFFKDKDNSLVIHSTYLDNKYCPQVLIDEALELKKKNYTRYEHTFLGKFIDDDDLAIIQRKWLEACIDAHIRLGIEPVGIKRLGYDVADSGADKNATTSTHGILTTNCIEWSGGKDELFISTKRVLNQAKAEGINQIIYDNVGVGAGVGSNLNELNCTIEHIGFNAGAKPINPKKEYKKGKTNEDAFKNLKAQAWFTFRDKVINTYNRVVNQIHCEDDEVISFSSSLPNLEKLLTELSTPREEKDGVGRMMVEKKADLAKRGIPSPNLADSAVMAHFSMNKEVTEIVVKRNNYDFF